LDAHDIYLIGENGQGKTNILEAIYMLSYGSSFRTRYDSDLVSWGCRSMSVCSRFRSPEETEGNISITWENGRKTIKLHGKRVVDRKELLRRVPAIAFVHNDFLFASGPPERRRWFMDQTLSLHDPYYINQLRCYRKLLHERNYILRTRNFSLLDYYSEQLALAGLTLVQQREEAAREFGDIFSTLFKEVSGIEKEITLVYQPSWGETEDSKEVMECLRKKKAADIVSGTTSTGPHRDRFLFVAGERDFAKSASTGQQRLLSLLLRVAQARFYYQTTGRKPILLLDDVLLELDPLRRRLFRDRLPAAEQIFYTFLPGEETGKIGDDSHTYEVKDGTVYER